MEEQKVNRVKDLFKQSFNYSASVVLFPIRHHSPVCAYHLNQVIQDYNPEVILIEGPRNAKELMEDLTRKENKTPFCLYLSYDDQKGLLGEKGGKYRAYYPMLDYSPELVAIREGHRLNIPTKFIDLCYHEKLYHQKDLAISTHQKLDEDRLFTVGSYYKRLCEKEGCRNFNELWEKLFEIKGFKQETKQFVENLFCYCYYTREIAPLEELKQCGDLAREAYMKKCIKEAQSKYKRILVVTGGIHTIALADELYADDKGKTASIESSELESILRQMPVEASEIYLMPYSYEESDVLKGYASGMAFPYFYQKVWELMVKNKKSPYEETVLGFMIQVAKKMRKKQPTSITDEMQAYYMANGLATLRDKLFPGAFELIDGVQSAFIKGEHGQSNEPVLEELSRLMTGMKMGMVDVTQKVPPIILDFKEQCKRFRISLNVAGVKEIRLNSYEKEEHRLKSCFLNQMQYLETEFCTYQRSQEDRTGVGRILLKETWTYQYTPKVHARLIDQSVYGGNVRAAALYLLAQSIKKNHHTTESLASQLELAEKMGMDELYTEIAEDLETVIASDMDFMSVTKGLSKLSWITERMKLRKLKQTESFKALKLKIFHRIVVLMVLIRKAPKEEEDRLSERLKFLYEYLLEEEKSEEEIFWEEQWLDAAQEFFKDQEANNALVGTIAGILLKKNRLTINEVMDKLNWYIRGGGKAKKDATLYMKGFFKIAKDTVFIEPKLLEAVDQILREVSEEMFLEILPDLRLAFTYFLPFEIDKIAKKVAQFYQVTEEKLLWHSAVEPQVYSTIKIADAKSYELIQEWFGTEYPVEAKPLEDVQNIKKQSDKKTLDVMENLSKAKKLEQLNRWRLVLGRFAQEQLALDSCYEEVDQTLQFLYDREYTQEQGIRDHMQKRGGREYSALTVPMWLDKIKQIFPQETVEVMQKQALDKYQILELLLEKDILEKMQPDMSLLRNILSFKSQMKGPVLETARKIVKEVVEQIKAQLEKEVCASFLGKRDPYKSSQMRVMRNFDFKKTVRKNLRNYDMSTGQLIPERLYFCSRVKRYNPYHIFIVVDESGSMMDSIIYSAVMAGIFSGLSMLKTDLVIFDTSIVDLTDYVSDPVEVLMKIQLGGGTNISKALRYVQGKMTDPHKSIVVLVSDLYDGYDYRLMYTCVHDIVESGANMFVLPALDYEGCGNYDRNAALHMASLGAQVAAITPKELANWIAKIVL